MLLPSFPRGDLLAANQVWDNAFDYGRRGNFREAQTCFEQYAMRDPTYEKAWCLLSEVHQRNGNPVSHSNNMPHAARSASLPASDGQCLQEEAAVYAQIGARIGGENASAGGVTQRSEHRPSRASRCLLACRTPQRNLTSCLRTRGWRSTTTRWRDNTTSGAWNAPCMFALPSCMFALPSLSISTTSPRAACCASRVGRLRAIRVDPVHVNSMVRCLFQVCGTC